jgi:uncharacterized damage-inducible protein DinB
MNSYMQGNWQWVEPTHKMRYTLLLDTLTDADLAFTPGGTAMTLGALCRECGDVQHAYVESLKHFTQDFSWTHPEAKTMEASLAKLREWYQAMDADMESVLSAMSEDDLKKLIDRGGGFSLPVTVQMDIYLQALLIFFGKASIYLRAMNRPIPQDILNWIG